jgi:hypothetical protein
MASFVKVGEKYINLDQVVKVLPSIGTDLNVYVQGEERPIPLNNTESAQLRQKLEELKI